MVKRSVRGGFALALVLWFLVLALMAALGLAHRARQGAAFQLEDAADLEALYAAEAGVAYALTRWSNDDTKTWGNSLPGGFVELPLQNGTGKFRIRFGPNASVNNLNNESAADGPLGPGSVPARLAYLVVDGMARGRTRRLEVMVSRMGLVENPPALVAGGGLELAGDVTITGLRSLTDNSEAPADLICLNTDASTDTIHHSGTGSINIGGSVVSNNSRALSASLSTANITGGRLTGQSRSLPDRVDITGRVDSKASLGLPSPTLTGTHTQIAAGDYFVSGDLEYDGDLELNGANLYVTGNLRVNGTVAGKGAVFVKGDSQFLGDSSIRSSDSAGVAVFSEGDIELAGFDGNTYLRNVVAGQVDADGIPYTTHVDNMQAWTRDIHGRIPVEPVGNAEYGHGGTNVDAVVVGLSMAVHASHQWAPWLTSNGIATAQSDPVNKLRALLDGQPDTATNRFMKKRLLGLNGGDYDKLQIAGVPDLPGRADRLGIYGRTANYDEAIAAIEKVYAGTSTDGMIRSFNALWEAVLNPAGPGTYGTPAQYAAAATLREHRDELWHANRNVVGTYGFSRPGDAFFQGLIYSRGNIVAENGLTVIGSIVAAGANSNVDLRNGVQVKYVPEVSRQAGAISLGRVGVRTWIRR
jgi:hypothetical protein